MLSVAVYNHYKRLHHNIPASSSASNSAQGKQADVQNPDSARILQNATFSSRGQYIGMIMGWHVADVSNCLLFSELLQIAGISEQGHALGPGANSQSSQEESGKRPSDILDATKHELKLEKSNILMLGPTGSGEFILSLLFLLHG